MKLCFMILILFISIADIDLRDCTNAGQVNLGRRFFRRLIEEENAFREINEENMCALVQFFFHQAAHNGRSVEFSSGLFVLYDPTERFFNQLMRATLNQKHSDEHRSGFLRRPFYFVMDLIQSIFRRSSSRYVPLIYLRGDESSHFRERGNRYDRWNVYPAFGVDIPYGCMPKKFSHLLFGQLESLSNESHSSSPYRGHRIYIKPEQYGLQQFGHYLMHSNHYIRVVLQNSFCRIAERWNTNICKGEGAFHEWIDRGLVRKWTAILNKIENLTREERHRMEDLVSRQGIREIYRQMLLFPSLSNVNEIRSELEHRYGNDVGFRKGHEIIFTTTQLLNTHPVCDRFSVNSMYEPFHTRFVNHSLCLIK